MCIPGINPSECDLFAKAEVERICEKDKSMSMSVKGDDILHFGWKTNKKARSSLFSSSFKRRSESSLDSFSFFFHLHIEACSMCNFFKAFVA